MNRNEFAYPKCRGRNRNFRGRGAKAVNVQRPLVPKTTKASRKKAASTNYGSSTSSIKWKNDSSTSNNVTDTVTNTSSSRTFNTTDVESKIVIAVSTGTGEASYEVGIAVLDVYQPTLILCEISDTPSYINTLTKINILNPDEILIPLTFINKSNSNRLVNKIKEHFKNVTITAVARASYNKTCGMVYIKDLCALQWNSIILALQHKYHCLTAASALLNYIESYLYILYSKNSLKVEYQESEGYCIIDVSTADRLELVASNASNTNNKYSSLYGVLNHCYTRIGSRTLRATILQPPCSVPDIEARLDCVTELKRNSDMMIAIQTILPKISNIDQLLSLSTLPSKQGDNFSERHLMYVLTLNALLDLVQPLRETFKDSEQPLFKEIISILDNQSFKVLTHVVRSLIQPDARPVKGRQGSIEKCFLIKPGVNGLLDILRKTYSERVEDLREYVRQLRDKYNLPLSLSNNSKKGYHIVLQLNAHTKKSFKKSELPLLFIQVERLYSYVTMKTIELMNLATRIDDILEEIYKMSSIMVYHILIKVRDDIGLFYKLCEVVAKLDMIQSIAQASNAIGYIRPKFGDYLDITNSKHPLLEYLCSTEPTPNNIFATDAHNVHIITGPNGSGKSIFIRQILLLQVMAQVGCYIPAQTAILRVCDRVLARISFDDNLDCGASSFVLEVKEIQYFHTVMTSNTLIIIDEACRSTAVVEGTALAMAIVESLAKSKAFIFLATHFTFITKLEEFYPNVMNWQMDAIQEEKERIALRFTYNLISGVTAFRKYGLIAATASWPKDVVEEAERLYAEIEPPKDHAKVESLGVLNRLKYNFEAELKLLKLKKQLTSPILERKLGEYVENLKEAGLDVAQYLPQNLTFECPDSGQNDARGLGDEASGVLYPQVVYSPSQNGEITGYDRFCQELQRPKRDDDAKSSAFLQNLSSIKEENRQGNLTSNIRVLSPNQITNQSRWFGDFSSVSQNYNDLEEFGVNMGKSNSIEWKSTSNIQILSPIGGQDLNQVTDQKQRSGETLSPPQNYNLGGFLSPIGNQNPHRSTNQDRYCGGTSSVSQNFQNFEGFGANMRNSNSIASSSNTPILPPIGEENAHLTTNQNQRFDHISSASQNYLNLEDFGVNMRNSNSNASSFNTCIFSPRTNQNSHSTTNQNRRFDDISSVPQNYQNFEGFEDNTKNSNSMTSSFNIGILSTRGKQNPHLITNQNRHFSEAFSAPQTDQNLGDFGDNIRNSKPITTRSNTRILSSRGEQNHHLSTNQNQRFDQISSAPQNYQNFEGFEDNMSNFNSISSSPNSRILSPRGEQNQHLITNQDHSFHQISSAPQNYQNFEGFGAKMSNFNSVSSSPHSRILSPRGQQNLDLITNQNQRFNEAFLGPQTNQNWGGLGDSMRNSKMIAPRSNTRCLSRRRDQNPHLIINQNQRFGEALSVPQKGQNLEGFEAHMRNSKLITSKSNTRILPPRGEQNQHIITNQNHRFGESSSNTYILSPMEEQGSNQSRSQNDYSGDISSVSQNHNKLECFGVNMNKSKSMAWKTKSSSNTHILSPMEEQGSNQTRSQNGYLGEVSSLSQNNDKLECFGVNMDNSKSIAWKTKSSCNTHILSPTEEQGSNQTRSQNGYFGEILSVSQNYENFVDFGVNMNNSKSIAWKTTTTSTTYIQTTPINKEQSQNLSTDQRRCFGEILSAPPNDNLEENLGNSSLIAWLTKSTSDIDIVSPIEDQHQLISENPCFSHNLGDNLVLSNSMALKTKSSSNIHALPVIEGEDQITEQNGCFGEIQGNLEEPIRALEPPKPNVIIRSIHVFNKDEKLTRIQQFDQNQGKLVEIEGFKSLESDSSEQDVIPASPSIFSQVHREFKGGFSGHHHESVPSIRDHEGSKPSLRNSGGKDFQTDLKNRGPETKSNLTVQKSLSNYFKSMSNFEGKSEEIKAPALSSNLPEENLNSYGNSFGSNTQGSFLASSKESLKRDVSSEGGGRNQSKMLMKLSGHRIPSDGGKSNNNRFTRFSGVGNSKGSRSVNDGKSRVGGGQQGFANESFAIQAEEDDVRVLGKHPEDVEGSKVETGLNDQNVPIFDLGKDTERKSYHSSCTTLKSHHRHQNSKSVNDGKTGGEGRKVFANESLAIQAEEGVVRILPKRLEDVGGSEVETAQNPYGECPINRSAPIIDFGKDIEGKSFDCSGTTLKMHHGHQNPKSVNDGKSRVGGGRQGFANQTGQNPHGERPIGRNAPIIDFGKGIEAKSFDSTCTTLKLHHGHQNSKSVNDGKSRVGGGRHGFANQTGQNSHGECPIDRNAIIDFGKDIEAKSFDSTCTTLKLHHSLQNSLESTVTMPKGDSHSRGPGKISRNSPIGESRIKSKDLGDGCDARIKTFTSTATFDRFKSWGEDVPRRNDDEAESNVTVTVEEPEDDFSHVINQPSKFLKRYFEDNHQDHKLLDSAGPSQNDEATQRLSKSIFEASGGSESLFSTPEAFFSAVDTTPVPETIETRPEPKPLVRKRKFKTPLKQLGNPPEREAPPKVRKARVIRPSLTAKFVPPKIPSKREILQSFAEQKREILDNSEDPDRVDKYMKFLENKPTVKQIQSQQYLAKIQRTDSGFVVIPASKPTVKRKKVIPLKRKLSSTEYDKTMFSDKNANKLKCLLETEENVFTFAAEDSVRNRGVGEIPGFSLNFSQPITSSLFESNRHGV